MAGNGDHRNLITLRANPVTYDITRMRRATKPGFEHSGIEVVDCHEHVGIGLAHGIGRAIVQQQDRLGVQGLERFAEQLARQAPRLSQTAPSPRAGNTCQHAEILGRVADGTERLAQRGAVWTGSQLAARTLGIV